MGKEGTCQSFRRTGSVDPMLSSVGFLRMSSGQLLEVTASCFCACVNPVGFRPTFDSCQDNPWFIFNHSCVCNTRGIHHDSHFQVVTVRVVNEELFP